MKPVGDGVRQLISFVVGDQEFCVDVTTVREIRGWTPATPIPQSPDYLRGVINLRGAIMPVVDLRNRLGYGRTEPEARHVIIVVECAERLAGVLVDAVCDTMTVNNSDIQAAPETGAPDQAFVRGIIPLEDRLITYLSMEDIFPRRLGDAAAELMADAGVDSARAA
ncbi:MAG TPA: chemotaxis protein CheW [Caulobacteraceae bacterium]|jgi:purine-binding chemotaxis protein CheW